MIVEDLITYLNDDDVGIKAYCEQPSELYDYVIVEQTGSSRLNRITTTTVAIQSYGETLYDAMLLNEDVKEAMEGFLELGQVARVELETDYNFTDTTTKQYRWQAIYNITHY